jgi:hypothetical protein
MLCGEVGGMAGYCPGKEEGDRAVRGAGLEEKEPGRQGEGGGS